MSKIESPRLSKPRGWTLPAGIFLGALAIRLIGIGWGLPNEQHHWSYHPDEPIVFAAAREIEPAQLDFEPGFYNYGTLYLSLLRIASDVVAGYGAAPSANDPESLYRWMGVSHLAGRVISALAGAGTAAVVFLMFRRRFGLFGALSAALLIGIAPAHVVHSRFQTVDVTATFLMALSAMYTLRLLGDSPPFSSNVEDPEGSSKTGNGNRDVLLAGLFAGLAASTKYTGGVVILAVYCAILISRRPQWLKEMGFSTGAAALAFLVTTPGVLLNFKKFSQDVGFEMSKTGQGLLYEGTSSGFSYHLANLTIGVGWILTLLGIAGLCLAAILRRHWCLVLLAYAIPYYLLIGAAEVKFLRYTFPLYIAIAGGFGWAMAASHRRPGWGRGVAALGILGLGGETAMAGLRGAALTSYWMGVKDPRDEAAAYLRSVRPGNASASISVGLVEDPWHYTPPLHPDVGMPRALYRSEGARVFAGSDGLKLVMHAPSAGEAKTDWDPRLISVERPDYIVFSSFEASDEERLSRLTNLKPELRETVARYERFRTALLESYRLERLFGGAAAPLPHDLEYIRPAIWIWKRKDLP